MSERKSIKIPKRKLFPALIIAAFVAIVAGIITTVIILNNQSPLYSECTVESGVAVSAEDFLAKQVEGATFTEESAALDITKPGEYELGIQCGKKVYYTKLIVTDTIAPIGTGITYRTQKGDAVEPANFVDEITDATDVTLSFVAEPDVSKVGEQKVEVLLTDEGGNTSTVEATLIISSVKSEIVIEAGEEWPDVSEFSKDADKVELLTDIEDIDPVKVGKYPLKINVDGESFDVAIVVKDTVPPVVTFKDVNSYTTIHRSPEEFIASAEDISAMKYSFVEAPDITKVGEQDVVVSVMDAGGNEVTNTCKLTLKEDTDYPVISGVSDITVVTGSTVSYKTGVTVTDECKEGLSLTVDNSSVHIQAAGVYPIVYTARDASGHETKATCNLIVKEREYSQAQVNSMADQVIAKIITPGMSGRDKCMAIYKYVRSHMSYISHSEKGNYLRGAYEGLFDGKGDCFVYAATAKVLLTRAGIPNYDIAKIPAGSSTHYWNLVDIGTGWLHFDCTPRLDHPTIFLWDDPTMMAYSNQHWKSHNYDHSIYPRVVGSNEGTLVPGAEASTEDALAQYQAALAAQQAAQEAAAAQEAQQAAADAAALAQYQAALAAMNGTN